MRKLCDSLVLYGAFGGKYSIITRFTVFSRKMLLLLLLVMPRSDPSSFSGPPGKALILDPGVSLSLCFSAQSRGRVLPDPGIFLSACACMSRAF